VNLNKNAAANSKSWLTAGLRASGEMIGIGNIHITKNLPASGRLEPYLRNVMPQPKKNELIRDGDLRNGNDFE